MDVYGAKRSGLLRLTKAGDFKSAALIWFMFPANLITAPSRYAFRSSRLYTCFSITLTRKK